MQLPSSQSRFDQLVYHNLESFAEAFQIDHIPYIQPLVHRFFMTHAQQITHTILGYDQHIDTYGMADGSRWLLERFSTSLEVFNQDQIPQTGPLLIVSNHPGMTDAMTIFATLTRTDIHVVAQKNPFISLLHNIQKYIIFVNEASLTNVRAVRRILAVLRAGHTVILFPAGEIEPDPAMHISAQEKLSTWSSSMSLFMKHIPELHILPVAIGGVISQKATAHPLVRLYQTQSRRDWVAATLMVMYEQYREVTVTVRYGTPIQATQSTVMALIESDMRHLIAETWQKAQRLNRI
ncbi:MAG: 1-acyl-sn-glycerol-3-phosphate acyltransferase [Anaerolineae bacterium]